MDSFGEIGVFVRVVETSSFTRAAKVLGITASGVSRVVSRLEARLGVRLLDRTTRSLGLTADGAAYYERCSRVLRDLEAANVEIARSSGAPRGRLRVDVATTLGRHVVGPAIPDFLAAFPELSVDLSARDHIIDPIAEGIDVVVRMAELRESELIHKRVGAMRLVVVASPEYLKTKGVPQDPSELRSHATLGFLPSPATLPWRFRTAGRDYELSLAGRLHTNSPDAIVAAATAGLGVAQLVEWHFRETIARGALVVILREHEPPALPVHALFVKEKASLPKVRAFLDFLEERLKQTPDRKDIRRRPRRAR
ncbi:MAG TPA: LysR family transcriptional regulator [Polyangiaceae bacterium]